jgi:hypothetical protein
MKQFERKLQQYLMAFACLWSFLAFSARFDQFK